MERRHRSASRSRREERRTSSIRSSHESIAGNLSPGRQHGHRRESGGGFLKNLFGRRDKHHHGSSPQERQLPQQFSGDYTLAEPPPIKTSPASKFKAMLSFAPHPRGSRQGSPLPARSPEGVPVSGLQQTLHELQDNYNNLESQLAAEQRAVQEWKQKWNYQNFKLNLMVDMLVLRVLELEQPAAAPSR